MDAPEEIDDAPDLEDEGIVAPAWERLADETPAAWGAFKTYLDLGLRRSLDAVDRRLYPPGERPESAAPGGDAETPRRRRGCISRWSRAHAWVSRAAAWDAHLDREGRVAQLEAVREMNRRHAAIAKAVQAKSVEALRLLYAGEMDAADVIGCIVEGSKLERLALGQVTDAVRQDVKAEGGVTLEVVERIVVVGDRPRPAAPPPRPTAGVVEDARDTADDGTHEPPDFDLPDESPFAACRLGVG